jgi:hypothetical protein
VGLLIPLTIITMAFGRVALLLVVALAVHSASANSAAANSPLADNFQRELDEIRKNYAYQPQMAGAAAQMPNMAEMPQFQPPMQGGMPPMDASSMNRFAEAGATLISEASDDGPRKFGHGGMMGGMGMGQMDVSKLPKIDEHTAEMMRMQVYSNLAMGFSMWAHLETIVNEQHHKGKSKIHEANLNANYFREGQRDFYITKMLKSNFKLSKDFMFPKIPQVDQQMDSMPGAKESTQMFHQMNQMFDEYSDFTDYLNAVNLISNVARNYQRATMKQNLDHQKTMFHPTRNHIMELAYDSLETMQADADYRAWGKSWAEPTVENFVKHMSGGKKEKAVSWSTKIEEHSGEYNEDESEQGVVPEGPAQKPAAEPTETAQPEQGATPAAEEPAKAGEEEETKELEKEAEAAAEEVETAAEESADKASESAEKTDAAVEESKQEAAAEEEQKEEAAKEEEATKEEEAPTPEEEAKTEEAAKEVEAPEEPAKEEAPEEPAKEAEEPAKAEAEPAKEAESEAAF